MPAIRDYALITTEKELVKHMQRLCIPINQYPTWPGTGCSGNTLEIINPRSGAYETTIVCIDINSKMKPDELLSTIIHESVHVWQIIRETIGETNPSKEFEAYSIQTIADNLIFEYKRQKKNARR